MFIFDRSMWVNDGWELADDCCINLIFSPFISFAYSEKLLFNSRQSYNIFVGKNETWQKFILKIMSANIWKVCKNMISIEFHFPHFSKLCKNILTVHVQVKFPFLFETYMQLWWVEHWWWWSWKIACCEKYIYKFDLMVQAKRKTFNYQEKDGEVCVW